MLEALTTRYRNGLARALRMRWLVIAVGVVVAVSSGFLFTMIKSELAPVEDRGVIFGVVNGPEGSTVDYTLNTVRQIEGFYTDVPEMLTHQSIIGFRYRRVRYHAPEAWNERERSRRDCRITATLVFVTSGARVSTNPPSFGQRHVQPVQFVVEPATYPKSPSWLMVSWPGCAIIRPDQRRYRLASEHARVAC